MDQKSTKRPSLFTFRLYGDELLTAPSRRWLFITRTCVLILATLEAISWAFAISQLGTSITLRWVLAIATFVTFFCFLYMLDSSLMTLDRGKTRYDEVIFPERKNKPKGKWPWFTALKESLVASMVARAFVVSVSIFITAPFFTQFLFSTQVQQQMVDTEKTQISEKRATVTLHYDTILQRQKADLAKLEEHLPKAIDGSAIPNKRFGFGPVSSEIMRQIEEKKDEIAKSSRDKETDLARFDRLNEGHNIEQLIAIYNIRLVTDSPESRQQAMDELKKKPYIKEYELIIKSLLYVLFFVLLIFKFNEPSGIKIYFSDCLHECFGYYREGRYNHLLLPQERPGSGYLLKAHGFEEFMLAKYVKNLSVLQTDTILQQIELCSKMLATQAEKLQTQRATLQTTAQPALDRIEKDLFSKVIQCEVLNSEIRKMDSRSASINELLNFKYKELKELEASLQANQGMGGALEALLAIQVLETKKEIRKLKEEMRDVTLSNNEKETSQKRLVAEIGDLEKNQLDLLTPLNELDAMILDNFKKSLYWEAEFMRHNSKSVKEESGERGAGEAKEEQTGTDDTSTNAYKSDKARQN